jgi:hypothetical protein
LPHSGRLHLVNTTAENAIHEWIRRASGLAAEQVVWEGRHPYPTGPWILMRVDLVGSFGQPWSERAPSGDLDIEYKSRSLDRVVLQLQAIAGGEGGEASCVALLKLVIAKRLLPSFAQALSAAGVGVLLPGEPRWVAAGVGSAFEPRAVVDIELTLASEVSETGPAIKHIEVEGSIGLGTTTTWVPDAPPAPPEP